MVQIGKFQSCFYRLAYCLLFFPVILFGQRDTSSVYSAIFENDFLVNRYVAPSLDHVMDNFIEGMHLQLDANASFSRIDDLLFSMEGNSFLWNHQYLNEHRIDNPILPGRSFIKPDVQKVSISLNRIKRQVSYQIDTTGILYNLQFDNGFAAGRLPHSDGIVNKVYGHSSSFQRARGPLDFRKRINFQINLSTPFIKSKFLGFDPVRMSLLVGQRDFVEHNYNGMISTFPENYFRIDFVPTSINENWNFLAGIMNRSEDGKEIGYNRQETGTKMRTYLSIFKSKKKVHSLTSFGVNLVWERLRLSNSNFSKNIIDQDGEIFDPWRPSSDILSLSHHLRMKKPFFGEKKFSFELDSYNSLLMFLPAQQTFVHPIYLQTDQQNYTPVSILEIETKKFGGTLIENQMGIRYNDKSSSTDWEIDLLASISFDGLSVSGGSLSSLNWNTEAIVSWKPLNFFRMKLEASKVRIPFNFNDLKFVSDNYIQGTFFVWNDDGNMSYTENEKSISYSNTGSAFHSFSDNLKQAFVFRLAIPIQFEFHQWKFGLTPVYKSFRNIWTVSYNEGVEEMGFYDNSSYPEIYFTPSMQEINYKVVPFSVERMQLATTKKNWEYDFPFYASFTTHLTYQTSKIFFYASFQAYMAIGFGPIGNGPLANNLGILSESLADPNTYIHYLGRLNSDRSFVARALLSYQQNEKWAWALQVKFKDGQPFNYFNTRIHQTDQDFERIAIWNQGIKGDNPFTGEFNSRTDGLWNWEIRIKYVPKPKKPWTFEMFFYNLLDLGMEIREFSFRPANPSDRAPLELEIPRGFSIRMSYFL